MVVMRRGREERGENREGNGDEARKEGGIVTRDKRGEKGEEKVMIKWW